MTRQTNWGPGRLIVEVCRSHTDIRRHPAQILWSRDHFINRGRYLHNTQQTHGTNIHALSGIRNRDSSH